MKSENAGPPPSLRETASLVGRLIAQTLAHRKPLLAGAAAFMAIGAAATAGFAGMIRFLVDGIFVDSDPKLVWTLCIAIAGLSVAKAAAVYFQNLLAARIRKAIVGDLQRRQFSGLMRREAALAPGRSAAKVMSKLVGKSHAAAFVVLTLTRNLFRDLLTLLALAAVMVFQDPAMSAIAILAAPAVFVVLSRLSQRTRKLGKGEIAAEGAVVSVGAEALLGIRTVKAFHLEDRMSQAFGAAVEKMEARSLKLHRIAALAGASMELLGGLAVVAFLLYASWRAATHGTTPGQFTAFLAAFLLAYEPAKKIAGVNLQLQRKLAATAKLVAELDDDREPRQILPDIGPLQGAIALDGVRYSHKGRKRALDEVTLAIAAGEKIGIAGRSGAGKTTLVDLVLAAMRPDKGRVRMDGRDIAECDPASVRANVSLVTQEVFLFSGSIADNIEDGKAGASRAEIEEAAKRADVDGFAGKLPLGLDTPVGANGAGLSGGEKQRVAIARALLKRAPILVFDEATSALDGETERAVLRNGFAAGYAPTVLCVTHRLSALREMDRVVLLDRGHVEDVGTIEELSGRSELFRSLFHLDADGDARPSR